MDLTVIITIVSFLILLVMGATFYFLTNTGNKEKNEAHQRENATNRERAAGRRAQMLRNRGARARRPDQLQDEAEGRLHREETEEEVPKDVEKLGAKKRAKMEAKAEKKLQREAEEHSRQDRRRREEQALEERRKQEEKEKALEKQRDIDERKAREEKERREHEEYLRMKEAFKIEEEGCEESDGDEHENILQEFVNFIKEQKVVVVEDLASKFKLKTQAAIDRIKDLQHDGILTGVIDDRGKFIYVSPEEMAAVAKFIRQRGRVSIQELAQNSNELIRLAPTQTIA